jgi:hypothetical protein
MLEMLEWVKQRLEEPTGSQSKGPAKEGLLPDLRAADPVTALNELSGWLEPGRDTGAADPKSKSEFVARVQEAGAAHVSALFAQYLSSAEKRQTARDWAWKSLLEYQSRLMQAMGALAETLLKTAEADAAHLPAATLAAARALRECRTFAKACHVHYSSVPRPLWRMAYAIHARAERTGCAASPVNLHADHRTVATVEQELLRLLLLQVCAPDMMAPEQIETADRMLAQLGDFTLPPAGATDNPFCFDPAGDAPPRRAAGSPAQPAPAARYFGPGMGFAALERIHKQWAAAKKPGEAKLFGADIAPGAQSGALQHLMLFWRAENPYLPPPHAPASGSLKVIHGYEQIWSQLSAALPGAGGLSLADPNAAAPRAPETWTLCDAGGNELGAELPQASGAWTKCGGLVGLQAPSGENWVGVIRRMHADASLHADIAVVSRKPLGVTLREVLEKGEDRVFTEASAKQFGMSTVHALILADGSDGAQPANLVLPPESWKEGRVYELQGEEPLRYLRGVQLVRRGDDYVRATFQWLPKPGG